MAAYKQNDFSKCYTNEGSLSDFLYHIYISDTNVDLMRHTGHHSRGSFYVLHVLENSFAMQLRGENEGRDWWRGSEGRDRVRETEKQRGDMYEERVRKDLRETEGFILHPKVS